MEGVRYEGQRMGSVSDYETECSGQLVRDVGIRGVLTGELCNEECTGDGYHNYQLLEGGQLQASHHS